MKITAIARQVKRPDRYSVFIDGKYYLSLSANALLESQIVSGMEISQQDKESLQIRSAQDKIYGQVLNYLALRPRSKWEIESYLKRKQASPSLTIDILNELSIHKYIDDASFTRAYINNAQLLHPASKRKLTVGLKQKHIDETIINQVIGELDENSEASALLEIIAKKRKQSRYKDDVKLMQYLYRQGFSYGDIKEALKKSLTD
jgi:regulatory protein